MGNEQAKDRVIEILYRNHRGEIAVRRIEPVAMRFESTEWHPEPQWIIDAWDVDKQARRSFAFKDILPAPLVWSSERPKVAGEYCVRSKADHSERYCWNVGQFEIDFPPPWYSDFEFCLIPEPLEKESGG